MEMRRKKGRENVICKGNIFSDRTCEGNRGKINGKVFFLCKMTVYQVIFNIKTYEKVMRIFKDVRQIG